MTHEPTALTNIATRIRIDQHEMLRRITTYDVPLQEHIMRALDVYLSTHAIQQDLAAKQEQV